MPMTTVRVILPCIGCRKSVFKPCRQHNIERNQYHIGIFKDMLDKLGVDVQLIRHGKFKAAAERADK